MSEPEMSFHKRLRVALAWSDISPMELSRRLGVTRQAVHGWTHQGKYPRSSHLVQIARETGFSIDWLMQSGDPFYQQPIIEELLSNNKLLANLLGQAGIELPPETRP